MRSIMSKSQVFGEGPGMPERSSSERSEGLRSGGLPGPNGRVRPSNEVEPKPSRRRFTSAFKLAFLAEADRCKAHGEVGALLRREALYASHLASWRRARDAGQLVAGVARPRGPRKDPTSPLKSDLDRAERRIQKLERDLNEARAIIEVQKKMADIFARIQDPAGSEGRAL